MDHIKVLVCVKRPNGTYFYIVHYIELNGTLSFMIKPSVQCLDLKFKDGVLDTEASKDYLKFQKEFEELPESIKKREEKTAYKYFFVL